MTETKRDAVAIIGAGTMGWQIALQLAAHGTTVNLYDRDQHVLTAELEHIRDQGALLAGEGLLPEGGPSAVDHVNPANSLGDAVAGCWYVVEAIPERMDLKQRLFAELSAVTEPETILATNSSSFRSAHLVESTRHPSRLMNSHFYNVPWRRSGVELMTCGQTDPENIERVVGFLRRCGLVPVIAQAESTGFVFNRIWHAVKRESLKVVAEGVASAEDVDRLWCLSMEAAIGPFAMMDRVGLDVVLDIERHYAGQSGNAEDEPPEFLIEMVAHGDLGRKTGRGFYTYPNPAWQRPGWPRDHEKQD